MRVIALVRHPALRGVEGLCYGRSDAALADPQRDIAALRDALGDLHPARVYTSPSPRCLCVARSLADSWLADRRLLELDFGAWEGQPWDALPRAALDRWAADPLGFAPPDGESGVSLIARVQAFAADLVAETGDQIVITHAGPLKVLIPSLQGQSIDLLARSVAFGSVTRVTK